MHCCGSLENIITKVQAFLAITVDQNGDANARVVNTKAACAKAKYRPICQQTPRKSQPEIEQSCSADPGEGSSECRKSLRRADCTRGES